MTDYIASILNELDQLDTATRLITAVDVSEYLKQSEAFLKYGTIKQTGEIIIFGLKLEMNEYLPPGTWMIK